LFFSIGQSIIRLYKSIILIEFVHIKAGAARGELDLDQAVLAQVELGSLAEAYGLRAGDRILRVNGKAVRDLIDFQFEWADERVALDVLTGDGRRIGLDIRKGYDQGLGAVFESAVFDGIRPCRNHCLFCFVDQMPEGLRESLYIKDDDYRLSFTQGSFVTLTNVTERDLRRIRDLRLSPLYVSVHATDPLIRGELLGLGRSSSILEQLESLSKSGIQFHTQVVLCPGYNDGEALERTYRDLSRLEGVLSMAVAPVGLTRFRQGLSPLRLLTGDEARALAAWIRGKQEECAARLGSRFIWAADEVYIIGDMPFPAAECYEDFPQLENGVGMIPLFYQEFAGLTWPERLSRPRRRFLASGVSAFKAMGAAADRFNRVEGFTLERVAVEHAFFGRSVTVSGLLTGACLERGLSHLPAGSVVCLPDTMILTGGGRFLDGKRPEDVERALNVRLEFFPPDAEGMQEVLLYG
jgi:putative radical SAM enzyme (TIGR03279 family)